MYVAYPCRIQIVQTANIIFCLRQDFSCRRGPVDYRSGKPKDLRCSFQSSGMFFIICAMDNPSGSAPATIASTMSCGVFFENDDHFYTSLFLVR